MTKDEFLQRARDIHGDKYNYPSLTDKVVSTDTIDIEYNGTLYKQKVVKHITMKRCPEKFTERKTTKQFIDEAKVIWGDKYDYSLVKYTNALSKVKIIYDGIIYEQVAISHLKGLACERLYNKESFIAKAIAIHGDKYDYSLVDYKTIKDKVKVIHKETGIIYEQIAEVHLKSSPENISVLKTTEEFIKDANLVHNNRYTYENANYVNSKTKIVITCSIHGDFKQNPTSHLSGSGCRKCKPNRAYKTKYNTKSFIEKATEVWGDKYDYSLVKYKNGRTKIEIIYDSIVYEQYPLAHLKYPVEHTITKDIFIKKAKNKYGDRYNYTYMNYINMREKVKILLEETNTFYEQTPHNHLRYQPENRNIKTQEEFILESNLYHNYYYNYDKVNYINGYTKVIIICPIHGDYEQMPCVHIKSGCPRCNQSKGEKKIDEYLVKNNHIYVREKKFDDCKNINNLRFDFYIPSKNLLIEYNGIQHYESIEFFGGNDALKAQQENDNIKVSFCEKNSINLLIIKYDDLEDIDDILYNHLN